MTKKILASVQTTKFQQIIIFFTIFFIGTMLIVQYKQSYFSEENYEITKSTETEKRLASKVDVGLHINNFPKFSFYKNSFIMDSVVWFKFPIGSESLHTIENFSFRSGEILSKSEPVVQISGKNVITSYQTTVKFTTPLNYKNFPVSDHKLTIVLQNKTVSPAELYFVSNEKSFELSKKLSIGNWKPGKQYVESGYIQTKYRQQKGSIQTDFPSVVFTIDFKNEDLRHFIILYLPLFLIFFLIFTSLLTKIAEISLRLPIVAGVVPILALHSLVIESASPTGSNITKIDQIYLTLVLLALVILLFQAYVGLTLKGVAEKAVDILEKKKKQLKLINDIVIVTVLAALIISLTYSTFT